MGGGRAGRAALALVGASTGLMLVAGLLGPSVAQPPLGPRRPHPPYSLFLEPDPWLVSGLVAAALVLGVAAVATGLLALRRGWAPDPRRLLVARRHRGRRADAGATDGLGRPPQLRGVRADRRRR